MATDLTKSLVPALATVAKLDRETPDVVTLTLKWHDPDLAANFSYKPGQFIELSVFGSGESTFVINSLPNPDGLINVSIKKVGSNTQSIHALREGDTVGLRGPYGNSFPVDAWVGKDLVIVGGGIGLAPLRPLINYVLAHRADYGKVQIVYGARTPADLMYRADMTVWQSAPNVEVTEMIDVPAEGWSGRVGLVPNVLKEVNPPPAGKVAITCGPPIMIKFTIQALKELGYADDAIFTTLEMKMKCGLGKCGRCNIGGKYVCKDGPVFSWAELGRLPEEY